METTFSNQYPYLHIAFNYNNNDYSILMRAEYYTDAEGLDFTGSYHCIVLSSHKGTDTFLLMPDPYKKWETDPLGTDPGLIDVIAEHLESWRS